MVIAGSDIGTCSTLNSLSPAHQTKLCLHFDSTMCTGGATVNFRSFNFRAPPLCSWHVNKTFQHQAKVKIRDVTKRKSTVDLLMGLKSEVNTKEHSTKLNLLHDHCNGLALEKFYDYLLKYYFGRAQEWADAYREPNCLNTNMHLESFHSTFKVCYLDRHANFRVDFTISRLLQYLDDREHKFFRNKAFKVNNKKMPTHSLFTKKPLKIFMIMKSSQMNQIRNFFCKEKKGTHIFAIEKIQEHDDLHYCMLHCKDCKICIHDFKCSCLEYSVSISFASIYI